MEGVEYIGADIVPEVVARNQQKYASSHTKFVCLDIISQALPKVDLILCRDCLIHFSYADIEMTLKNLRKSGSSYLLTTNYVNLKKNSEIITGSWREINLRLDPFNFPEPIRSITEQSQNPLEVHFGKGLGLWRLEDLPVRQQPR